MPESTHPADTRTEGATEMVWIVTKRHEDDREVVQGVFAEAVAAYELAAELTKGMSEPDSQQVSVMAHEVKDAADA